MQKKKKKKKDRINTVYESIKISHMLIIKSLSLYFQNHQSKTKGHDQHVCVCVKYITTHFPEIRALLRCLYAFPTHACRLFRSPIVFV